MPFKMTDIQSVILQEIMYVGGGDAGYGNDKNYAVMAYHTHSQKWHQLPPYTASGFAMVAINNELVLVGGRDRSGYDTNLLGVLAVGSRKWIHRYTPMPTPRRFTSNVLYKNWLIVSGGFSDNKEVTTVEVLDISSNQWFSAASAPATWSGMKSVIVEDVMYVMGGYADGPTEKVFSVSLPALASQISSTSSSSTPHDMWKTVSTLGHRHSSPLCLAGSLLALGGSSNKTFKVLPTIHRFLPDTEEWVVAGQLPSPLRQCTCTLTLEGQLLVIGGSDSSHKTSSKLYIGTLI